MPQSTNKKRQPPPALEIDANAKSSTASKTNKNSNKSESSEAELQIDMESFKTPTKKVQEKTPDSRLNSNRKRKRKRIKSCSTGEEEKLDLALEDIEDTIQSCIKKNKELTHEAIKTILRKLVKNEHVLAIVKLKEEEIMKRLEENGNEADDENDEVAMKLTRSKAKQMDKKLLPLVPLKQPEQDTEVAALLREELHDEDETDPEYQPDEDPNTTISDMDSLPSTPQSNKKSFDEPIFSNDGVFKIPRIRNESLTQSEGEAEPICKRTRTKLCLETTAIETLESTLIAPDITTDMYECDMDVDQHWAEFLNEFARPLNPYLDEDDPNDPEFTPLEPAPLDKEELRNVEISKQEYSNLIKELIDACDEKLLNSAAAEDESPKETERKLKSPKSIRKSRHQIVTDSPYRRTNTELNTPTPIEDISFQPNLMSTVIVADEPKPNQILSPENETIQVVVTDDENPIVTVSETTTTVINSLPTVSMAALPMNLNQVISLDGIMSQVRYENGVLQLPQYQQFVIQIPTIDLLKSSNDQTNVISNNNSIEIIATKNGFRGMSFFEGSSKKSKNKEPRVYEHLDFSPPSIASRFKPAQMGFTEEQRHIFDQQLRMHVQIAAQNFLQTYCHPVHWKLAETPYGFLQEFNSNVLYQDSPFNALNLRRAVQLTEGFKQRVDQNPEYGKEIVDWFYKEIEISEKCKKQLLCHRPNLPPLLMDLILSDPAFLYPTLLPRYGFKCNLNVERSVSEVQTGEEMLIAMGLEMFGELRKLEIEYLNKTAVKRKWKVTLNYLCEKISEHMVVCRTPKALYERVLNFKCSTSMNPVFYWHQFGKAPKCVHRILSINPNLSLKEQSDCLHGQWRRHLVSKDQSKPNKTPGVPLATFLLHREANNYNKKFVHQELSPNKSPEFEVSVDLAAVAKVDQLKTGLVSEISKETTLPQIQKQDQVQQIIAEEDLPLEIRANKKSKEIKKKEEPIQQINKDYKRRGRSYYKSLFRSVDVKDFALKLSKWGRKYDKNAVDRMVLHSTVLKKAFLQLKALDIYTTFLDELKKW